MLIKNTIKERTSHFLRTRFVQVKPGTAFIWISDGAKTPHECAGKTAFGIKLDYYGRWLSLFDSTINDGKPIETMEVFILDITEVNYVPVFQ